MTVCSSKQLDFKTFYTLCSGWALYGVYIGKLSSHVICLIPQEVRFTENESYETLSQYLQWSRAQEEKNRIVFYWDTLISTPYYITNCSMYKNWVFYANCNGCRFNTTYPVATWCCAEFLVTEQNLHFWSMFNYTALFQILRDHEGPQPASLIIKLNSLKLLIIHITAYQSCIELFNPDWIWLRYQISDTFT